MTEKYIPFKKGCVYKPLYSFTRIDPECFNGQTLFFKNHIYRCEEDGTLNCCGGTFANERISIDHKDAFVLVGHFAYQHTIDELCKKAMEEAYNQQCPDFDKFYAAYQKKFRELESENNKIDDEEIIYVDGQIGRYFNEQGNINESLI